MDEKTFEDDDSQNISVNETNPSIDKPTSAFNVPIPPQTEGISGNQNLESNFSCATPEKADEYLKGKLKEEEGIKLQEKYQIIVKFFTCLTSSVRLLKMRKKLPTFHNVSCQVSSMSERTFLHRHLAQMVYIIPEAMNIDKVMIHDEKTSCMKPEMIINLQLDIVEGHSEPSDFVALHKVFSSRVTKYFAMHPEKSEVPEGVLPRPFNQRVLDELYNNSSERSQPVETDLLPFGEAFPISPFFKRHFSKKAVPKVAELLGPVASSVVGLPSTSACSLKEGEDNNHELVEDFPARSISPQPAASSSESPIVKPVTSASSTIMTQTPVQLTPKRSMLPSSDVKMEKATASVGSLCKPAKRSLNFSGMESASDVLSFGGDDLQCYEIPEKKDFHDEHCQKNYNISGVTSQESSCLPELVRVIHNIFKSVNCFSITKEELVYKIIVNCLDITDRREVEEQIEQLEKLVPDWISKKLTRSGDVTFSINAKEGLESVLSKTICI